MSLAASIGWSFRESVNRRPPQLRGSISLCAWVWWLGTAASSLAQPTSSSDWPRYAHDGALTGHSPLKGNISQPHTAWSFSTAGRELLLEIVSAQGGHRLKMSAGELAAFAAPRASQPRAPRLLDLDGTGTLRAVHETFHERWAKILPDVKGWQRVAWNQTWTDEQVCRLQLFAYDQGFGKPRLVWQSEPPEATIFQPLNLIYDLDGDGSPEVCVAAHYRVMIFDGTSGRKETELRYHHSRPYGWFGLTDVDGDGQMELITIGDFQSHIDVLNYDPRKPEPQRLSVRWRRDLEENIDERKKWPQVGPHPVVDVTGNSNPELVLNLFNDTGDGQWHAVVLNAATGELLSDFPRRFLQGAADTDGDGKAELFLLGTDGALVPEYGRLELVDWHSGSPSVAWSRPHAVWACADLPAMEPTWSTTASQGMRHVLVAERRERHERPAFLVAERAANSEAPFATTIEAVRFGTKSRSEMLWQVSGLPGDTQFVALSWLEMTNALQALLRLRVARDTPLALEATSAQPRVIESHPLGVTVSTPIAARLRSKEPMTVVVEGAAQQIFALQPPKRGTTAPKLLWHRPGRGMGDGSRWLGPLAAELDGKRGKEIVVAAQDASGRATLLAYRHDGSRLWNKLFAQTPGALPMWNVGALTFWWPGHFRSSNRTDLFVNTRRGLMHSDVGQLLDGRTGAIVWQQEKAIVPGQFSWGYAGIPPAVADLDADGLDELISLYPVCFWVADGRTGRVFHGLELASRKALPAWAAYGEPMVHAFTGRPYPEVLLDSQYILALLDTNGAPLWHGTGRADFPTTPGAANVGQTTGVKHALADLDGDGNLELISAGYGDGVRAMNARDGGILWSLAAPAPTCPRVVTADIDGRKGDELLYVAGNKLIAITGNQHSGQILWEWTGPANLSMPAIADVDDDGWAELVVQAADGTVYCLDSEK